MRSTHRLPLSLAVPSERLRQSTPNRGPLRPVVRRLDAVVRQKDPERVHLPQQATGKLPCVVLTIMILVNQTAQPGVPGPPLPTRGGAVAI